MGAAAAPAGALAKTPTGIAGFDQLTYGGLPSGRPTLLCGGAGCGKTVFATEFLVRGATAHGEPGLFVTFEEQPSDLTKNVSSLGFDLSALEAEGLIAVEHIHISRNELVEAGEYDLEGLLIRLRSAIDAIGAKRVVLDTIEMVFSCFDEQLVLRSELQRMFSWLRERQVTTIVTAESVGGGLTRNGLEEFVSDCVILLDQRVCEHVTTRRLRVVKYRGSTHGSNEYPFLIDRGGISVFPVTSLGLDYPVSSERVSSGVPALDAMLSDRGYFRGSSILISGTAGTGKSSLAASFVSAACARGEKCLYVATEEPKDQIVRNMGSIGLHLGPWVESGLLRVEATRPTLFGLEMHLAKLHRHVEAFAPEVIVLDPISSLLAIGSDSEVKSMLVRLFDYLKMRGITTLLTCLTPPDGLQQTELGVSSLIDTWLEVRDVERSGERNRILFILKSRGMPHSNQMREFRLTERGIDLIEVYAGEGGVLTGSMRISQEKHERAEQISRRHESERRQRELERRRVALEAQIAALRAQFAAEEEEVRSVVTQRTEREAQVLTDRAHMRKRRLSATPAEPEKPT
jgi:circadian clock protein KaiC